jgi:hypothetical protein
MPVRNADKRCAKGSPIRDTGRCHQAQEMDPRLLGKSWASLTMTNLTELGVESFSDLMEAQV